MARCLALTTVADHDRVPQGAGSRGDGGPGLSGAAGARGVPCPTAAAAPAQRCRRLHGGVQAGVVHTRELRVFWLGGFAQWDEACSLSAQLPAGLCARQLVG